MSTFKECKKCEISLPLGDFNKMSSSKDGKQHICRECNSSYQKVRAPIRAQHTKARSERESKCTFSNKAELRRIWAKARMLTDTTGVKHQVDHLIPIYGKRDGIEIVCGFHVEYNVEIVSAEENMGKGNKVTEEFIAEEEKRLLEFCKNNNL